jgi:hypothetical protein
MAENAGAIKERKMVNESEKTAPPSFHHSVRLTVQAHERDATASGSGGIGR